MEFHLLLVFFFFKRENDFMQFIISIPMLPQHLQSVLLAYGVIKGYVICICCSVFALHKENVSIRLSIRNTNGASAIFRYMRCGDSLRIPFCYYPVLSMFWMYCFPNHVCVQISTHYASPTFNILGDTTVMLRGKNRSEEQDGGGGIFAANISHI